MIYKTLHRKLKRSRNTNPIKNLEGYSGAQAGNVGRGGGAALTIIRYICVLYDLHHYVLFMVFGSLYCDDWLYCPP